MSDLACPKCGHSYDKGGHQIGGVACLERQLTQSRGRIGERDKAVTRYSEAERRAVGEATNLRAMLEEAQEGRRRLQVTAAEVVKTALLRADDREAKAEAAKADPERTQESFAFACAALAWHAAADLVRSYFNLPADSAAPVGGPEQDRRAAVLRPADSGVIVNVYPCCDGPVVVEHGVGVLPCRRHGQQAIAQLRGAPLTPGVTAVHDDEWSTGKIR